VSLGGDATSLSVTPASSPHTLDHPSNWPKSSLGAITLTSMLTSGKPAEYARAYTYIGSSIRISPVVTAPSGRPHARSEITIGPLSTSARVTHEGACGRRAWSAGRRTDRPLFPIIA